jgi:hypothetical protein
MAAMETKNSLEVTHGTEKAAEVISDTDKASDASFYADKPFPTEEEFATLPRVPGRIPWTAWTVAAVEFAERFSYYGTTAVCEFDTAIIPTRTPKTLTLSSRQLHSEGPPTGINNGCWIPH